MAVQILHKRSAVEFKNATGAQLELGELALNYNESGPYLQCKDAAGEIVQLGGVFVSAVAGDAPGNPILGKWWLRGDTLFLYNGTTWVEIGGGSGGGGGTPGTITVIGGDGIEATTIGTTITVTADISTSRGLEFSGDQIAVKLGAGLAFDADGKIESTISGGLSYKGTVDVTTATVISGAAEGDLYANTGTGKFSSQWAATTSNATTATDANPGDWVIYQGPQWDHIPTTVTGTDLGIANRDDTDLDVTSSTGADVTIPAATTTLAGLMTAADKTALDSALQDGDADVNPLAGRALTYDAATDPDTLNADIATASALGVVKVGDGIDVDAAGEISVSFPPSETYIGETPPANPAEGDLWWNSSDNSGRLYVYYEDANSNQWVEASPQGDTLTESDADGLYLSKVSSDTAAGAITFEEQTTHEAGVNVTGGSAASVGRGLYSTNTNNIRLAGKGVELAIFSESQANFTSTEIVDSAVKSQGTFVGTISDFDKGNSFYSSPQLASGCTVSHLKHYHAFTQGGTGTATNSYGFLASANLADDGTNASYGFYSNLPVGSGTNYNFYAANNAPSFFQGLTEHAGGIEVVDSGITQYNGMGNIGVLNQVYVSDDQSGAATGVYSQARAKPGQPTAATATGDITLFFAHFANSLTAGALELDGDVTGLKISSNIGLISKTNKYVYGVWSDVDSSRANNFNFYAKGNAPNYFKGNTTCNTGLFCRGELHVQPPSTGGSFPGAGNLETGFRVQTTGVSAFSASHANATSFVTLFNRTNFNGTLISFRKNGNENGSIEIDDSNITIIGQTSDYRIKTNIQPVASAVSKIKSLNVVNFEYTDRAIGQTQEGFVAHELAEICPKAVRGTKDAEEAIGTLVDYDGTELETSVVQPDDLTYTEEVETDGVATMVTRTRTWTPTGTQPIYQGVDQTKLIPLLTKALQEVLTKNEDLEARIAALEGA